jgi:hypothetical protein
MAEEPNPSSSTSDQLQIDLKRLVDQSEKLRAEAKKNADEADRIILAIASIQKRVMERDMEQIRQNRGKP